MSQSLPLWMTIEPTLTHTQVLLTQPGVGTLLKGRLPSMPAKPESVSLLLLGLSAWAGKPLSAVIDADAEEVQRHPEAWARLLGEAQQSANITVEWSHPVAWKGTRPRFFEGMGNFSSARRLLGRSVLGVLP